MTDRDAQVTRLAEAMCQRRHHPATPAVSCQRCLFDAEAAIDAGATMRDPPPAPPAPEIVVPEELARQGEDLYEDTGLDTAYLAHWLRGEGKAVADAVIRERVGECIGMGAEQMLRDLKVAP